MNVYPVTFEAYENEDGDVGDLVFKVSTEDSSTASVSINTVVDVARWDEISAKVRECLVQMKLGETK